tara:strand:+ start:8127 stop:8324 length:198 start_codon:yes stop_codon:yes gene_type:complete
MIKKYKKELREQRATKRENQKFYLRKYSDASTTGLGGYMGCRNQYMIAHGKIKMLNMIIKDLSNL